jgi:copper chaperone
MITLGLGDGSGGPVAAGPPYLIRREAMPEITVKGMSCAHCVAAVTRAVGSLPGVSNVKVALASGKVTYESVAPISSEDLDRVVKAAGFELVKA